MSEPGTRPASGERAAGRKGPRLPGRVDQHRYFDLHDATCSASGARLPRRGAPMVCQSAITVRMGACTSSANGWGSVTVR